MGRVQDYCPKCKLKFNMEPSFYQGSYYVAYALGVALLVSIWVLKLLFFPNAGPKALLISVFVSLVVLSPWFYAISKIIWINFFIKFEKRNI